MDVVAMPEKVDPPAWRMLCTELGKNPPSDNVVDASVVKRLVALLALPDSEDAEIRRSIMHIMADCVAFSLCSDWFITVLDITYFNLTGKHAHFMLAARFKEPLDDGYDYDMHAGTCTLKPGH